MSTRPELSTEQAIIQQQQRGVNVPCKSGVTYACESTNGGLAHISDVSIERYRTVFNGIGADNLRLWLQAAPGAAFGTIQLVYVYEDMAEILLTRGVPPNARAYRVYLVKDIDGLWRIAEM